VARDPGPHPRPRCRDGEPEPAEPSAPPTAAGRAGHHVPSPRERGASTATVVGGSWLYNIDAYHRLFPPGFLATARAGPNEYQFIALWGQFLDRHGRVKPRIARPFLEGLEQRVTEESLLHGFPYRVLRLESAITTFYRFYGLEGDRQPGSGPRDGSEVKMG
jgi:hypothetical protein